MAATTRSQEGRELGTICRRFSRRMRYARGSRLERNTVSNSRLLLNLWNTHDGQGRAEEHDSANAPHISQHLPFQFIHWVLLVTRRILWSVVRRCPLIRQSEEEQFMKNHAERPQIGFRVDLVKNTSVRRAQRFWRCVLKTVQGQY